MADGGTGRLTTHVLDTTSGRPGSGLAIELFAIEGEARRLLASITTNGDGRCDRPLLEGATMQPGTYELVFHVADYFRRQGVAMSEPPFLDQVPLRFGIGATGQHYHVPLLISPFAYSTYRGS